jgi:hypothetical protein
MKEKIQTAAGWLIVISALIIALPSIIVGFYVSAYQSAKNYFDVAIRNTENRND